jgi:alpha-1,2-mannosyltransferase
VVRRIAIVAALAGTVAWFLSVAAARHGFFDLSVYWGAVNYWAGGHEIYDFVRPNAEYGFTYPPFAALVMAPMAVLSWPAAIVVSVVATVVVSAVILYRLVDPLARREGWTRWFAFAVAACLAAAYEPMRETVNFGQVNMLLVGLVLADLLVLVRPGRRLAGIGIGLATAIKLTPAIFVLYLLFTRRYRAAAVAVATATGATLLTAVVTPDETRVFWTDALLNTDRIGNTAFVSNQSIQGAVARLGLPAPWPTLLWGLLAVAVLVVWLRRIRVAVAAGDELTGYTLTAIAACLVSPITWVHHLVWILPAVPLLVGTALAAATGRRRRWWLLGFAIGGYALLCSRLVWPFDNPSGPLEQLGSDAYLLFCLVLLVVLPVPAAGSVAGRGEGVADLGDVRPAVDGVAAGGAVGDEPVPPVEPVGPRVPVERP